MHVSLLTCARDGDIYYIAAMYVSDGAISTNSDHDNVIIGYNM